MKKILMRFPARLKKVPVSLWNLFNMNPQLKDWIQIIAVITALIISAKSFNNSIKNSKKAEATYKSNLQKDSINMSNLKEISGNLSKISRNTENQTKIIEQQLAFSKQQLDVSQLQLKVSEKSVEEQISRGTPLYSLNQNTILYIDSLGIGVGKGIKSYKLEIQNTFHFTGSRTAYNVVFRDFFVINNEITLEDLNLPAIIEDINPNEGKTSFSRCRYPHKVDKLLLITEVTWFDKFLNKQHSKTSYSEYDKQRKLFGVCNLRVKKNLFDEINSYLNKKNMPKLRPDY